MPRESSRAWRAANPEKARASRAKWRDAHRPQIAEYNQAYRETVVGMLNQMKAALKYDGKRRGNR